MKKSKQDDKPAPSVLVVDDESDFHRDMLEAFQGEYDFAERAFNEDRMWVHLASGKKFDLILLDLKLDNVSIETGMKLIQPIGERYPDVPVIVVTNENDLGIIDRATQLGASDFLYKKKYNHDQWDKKFREAIENKVLRQKVEDLEAEVERMHEEEDDEKYRFIGHSPQVTEIKKTLRAVADMADKIVLLTGETGTGKEVAARFLHKNSPRSKKPFVAVNLSTIPSSMLAAELFGAKKGSYTDSKEDRIGYFRQADGGVLLLDEIGDINAEIQIQLLRFLEVRIVRPLGETKDIPVDLQIIVATHRKLGEEVQKGSFRPDLYQRLHALTIELPPLRERREDILPILEHYFRLELPNAPLMDLLEHNVLDRLISYNWPGNIRELRNAVDHMMLRRRILGKTRITWECLPGDVRSDSSVLLPVSIKQANEPTAEIELSSSRSRKEQQAYLELNKIETALRVYFGSKGITAEKLGYDNEQNLRGFVKTRFAKYPHLMGRFPTIAEAYSKNTWWKEPLQE
ncbi:MAG: sigma-54-dependent Fis family transcriptional regulator [Phycisphaerae bacterium]|nr:sigma-54-dependent Fis family transcriptional regulator [Saprospiraceae bacterium]